jgi:hypothetical protein
LEHEQKEAIRKQQFEQKQQQEQFFDCWFGFRMHFDKKKK